MRRLLFVLLVFVLTLDAANFKLYLKDGGFQVVREYQIEGDRVHYYSVERSDWEDIPAALVDLKRTEGEFNARKSALEVQKQEEDEEKAAAREIRQEIMKIPRDPGVYRLEDGRLRIFNAAESSIHNSKERKFLKAISPLPTVSGKATFEISGERSKEAVTDPSAEFYIQLSEMESFGIIKLTPDKGFRIAEHLTIMGVTKETTEQRELVPIFTKELSDNGLYKIWPQDPMEKGEYAVVEYTEGKVNMQIWDFRIE